MQEDFTNELYMNPHPGRFKYKDVAEDEGSIESQRRPMVLPVIKRKVVELADKMQIEIPTILPKGSAVVGKATAKSDFDIAVIVREGHTFTRDASLWRQFQNGLSNLDLGFRIDPRLVVDETRGYNSKRLDEPNNNPDNSIKVSKYIDIFKHLLE